MSIFARSPYPVGLDISDLSLKMVQLNKKGDKIKIQAIGKMSLPPGLIVDGEIINKKEVIKAINKLMANPDIGRVTSDEVIACLPEEKTFLKMVEIEKESSDIEKIIRADIEKNIPLSLDMIYYDWEVIEDLAKRKLVLIGAAPKNLVDQYIKTLSEAKLSVVALESEPVSICRSLLAEEHPKYKGEFNKNYVIIDIGATNSCIIFYSKDTILFTVSAPISGENLTSKIAEALKIERDEAEKIKISYGIGKKENKEVEKIFSETINDLLDKNKKALNFYNTHFSGWGAINKTLLCGGVANIKDLNAILANSSGIETIQADALINLSDKQKKVMEFLKISNEIKRKKEEDKNPSYNKIMRNDSLTFATAIGLALRGIFISYN